LNKEFQWQRPSYENLFRSLQNLKVRCKELQVTKLPCPRLGCGVDRLKWETVRKIMRFIFRDSSGYIRLYTKDELTEDNKEQIIKEFHENPLGRHQGNTRTYYGISQQYQWQNMKAHIRQFTRKYPTCQVNKTPKRTIKEPMVITTAASRPFEKVFMDIIGPLLQLP